jgi:hypothetical protein
MAGGTHSWPARARVCARAEGRRREEALGKIRGRWAQCPPSRGEDWTYQEREREEARDRWEGNLYSKTVLYYVRTTDELIDEMSGR